MLLEAVQEALPNGPRSLSVRQFGGVLAAIGTLTLNDMQHRVLPPCPFAPSFPSAGLELALSGCLSVVAEDLARRRELGGRFCATTLRTMCAQTPPPSRASSNSLCFDPDLWMISRDIPLPSRPQIKINR